MTPVFVKAILLLLSSLQLFSSLVRALGEKGVVCPLDRIMATTESCECFMTKVWIDRLKLNTLMVGRMAFEPEYGITWNL